MARLLRDLRVLVLDCQAGGATPAYGDLLEIGWAICDHASIRGPVQQHWVVPRTERRVPAAIRELTGWNERCISRALPERDAWDALQRDLARLEAEGPVPTLIHYARFELPFLHDLHERLDAARTFPFDTLCLHAIGARLFPDLPRRNIRALAGFLGHSPDLVRRSGGHVEASAAIWRGVLPLLEQAGVRTWDELGAWIADAPPRTRRLRRSYPLELERRRALPDRPGVYRFLRRNGDVLYVGKAASLRKRVAGHFKSRGDVTERALELLSQVHDIRTTETPSVLEAALLEADEIKRIDPPYNVQLRSGERRAWFASRDLTSAVPAPDDAHRIGPLPSERSLSSSYALVALAAGEPPTALLRAIALAVPTAFLPDDALFQEGWQIFAAEHLDRPERSAARRVDCAARALWLARGRKELESTLQQDAPPHLWDVTRVRRRLERGLVQPGLLMRRARWLGLLSSADVAYREASMPGARGLIVERGEIRERVDLPELAALAALPVRRWPRKQARQQVFDASVYDRLRVLATELQRVREEGGEVALRFGRRVLAGPRLHGLMGLV
ncbi:MAG TPA: GIY-YIG nuclease family protein [Polyangiales bacterium]|nr:GIY-YIG nuclease family protein [Polyangiales bacterium]